MAGASRKSKKSTYEVKIERDITYVATVEVQARTLKEAQELAEKEADLPFRHYWVEGDVLDQRMSSKKKG